MLVRLNSILLKYGLFDFHVRTDRGIVGLGDSIWITKTNGDEDILRIKRGVNGYLDRCYSTDGMYDVPRNIILALAEMMIVLGSDWQ